MVYKVLGFRSWLGGQLTRLFFMVLSLQVNGQVASQVDLDPLQSFPVYYLFALRVLSIKNCNLMQVRVGPRFQRRVNHICHAM